MNRCNCCGLEVPEHIIAIIEYQYGYFSKRDGDILNLKLCPECLERLTQKLIGICKVNPVREWTGDQDNPYAENTGAEPEMKQLAEISQEEYLKAEGF